MKKKKRLLLIIPIVLLMILVVIATVRGINKESKKNKNSIELHKVEHEDPITSSGKATPEEKKEYKQSDIGSPYNILVKNGDKVKQGSQIINYSVDNFKRQKLIDDINQNQNKVNQDYISIENSPNNKNLNNQLYHDLESLNQANSRLNDYDRKIYENSHAKFDGIVDTGSTKSNVLSLSSENSLVKINVNELDIDNIKEGDNVNVQINKSGKITTGVIGYISQSPISSNKLESDNSLSEYKVIINDINSEIRDGTSVIVSIPSKTLKIPKKFLSKDNKVFVLDKNNIAHTRNIKFKKQGGELIVTKGLKAGETIVFRDKSFNEGEKVEVSK